MTKAVAIVALLALLAPAAASAQAKFDLSLTPSVLVDSSQLVPGQRWEPPIAGQLAPQAPVRLERGVMAGVEVTPNARFGLGIFEGAPKRSLGAADPAKPERKSRRAAIGFSLKF